MNKPRFCPQCNSTNITQYPDLAAIHCNACGYDERQKTSQQ